MVSSEYGVRKPHRAIFLTAAGKLHLPPGDVWYVGDNYDLDVVGAAGAGMVPVWLNHQGVAIPAGAPEGLRSIGTLGELAGLR